MSTSKQILMPQWSRHLLFYGSMLVGAAGIFAAICLTGPTEAVVRSEAVRASYGHAELLARLLFALLLILATAQLLGRAFRYLRWPAVVGEIVAGILLGPSLVGRLLPEVSKQVFPTTVVAPLNAIAQVGVVLYMFVIGLELDFRLLQRRAQAAVTISHASIILPFLLGAALARLLFEQYAPAGVPFFHFALFSGVSLSVTAFPVLARILSDRGEEKSPLGALALTCAAVDDVTAWCLLALVVGVVGGSPHGVWWTLTLTVAYLAVMRTWVSPALGTVIRRFEQSGKPLDRTLLGLVILFVLGSALLTEYIGIHAIFGGFVAGAVIPADSRVARWITGHVEQLVVTLLLPVFFAHTGLRTQIGLVDSTQAWLLCGLIIATACAGKFGGTLVAARFCQLSWRDSAALGMLMNTRGLMELIVLNIGLDLGVISPALFAMLVLMAVLTTLMTTPILDLIRSSGLTLPVQRAADHA